MIDAERLRIFHGRNLDAGAFPRLGRGLAVQHRDGGHHQALLGEGKPWAARTSAFAMVTYRSPGRGMIFVTISGGFADFLTAIVPSSGLLTQQREWDSKTYCPISKVGTISECLWTTPGKRDI